MRGVLLQLCCMYPKCQPLTNCLTDWPQLIKSWIALSTAKPIALFSG